LNSVKCDGNVRDDEKDRDLFNYAFHLPKM
jgi:hypothetical protein